MPSPYDCDSVDRADIGFGPESLDVTLAYLKGKDAESEEAQESRKQQFGALSSRICLAVVLIRCGFVRT